jgi:predicted Holliday junction resolvase-like endonuclease
MKNFLIFIFVNIKLIFSLSLEKYGKIRTEDNIIVYDSSDCNLDDKIELKFTPYSTGCYCENNLHYQFYDLFKRVYQIYQANYSVYSSKEVIKDKKEIKYFTIYKSNKVLNGLDGNFLLLKYNCNGVVEIENISPKLKAGYIALIIILIIFVIVIIFIIIYCLRKKKSSNNANNINNNTNNNQNNENNHSSNNNNEIRAAIINSNNLGSNGRILTN